MRDGYGSGSEPNGNSFGNGGASFSIGISICMAGVVVTKSTKLLTGDKRKRIWFEETAALARQLPLSTRKTVRGVALPHARIVSII
jgi:hypothetical protein